MTHYFANEIPVDPIDVEEIKRRRERALHAKLKKWVVSNANATDKAEQRWQRSAIEMLKTMDSDEC